jgi:hypothetical protein
LAIDSFNKINSFFFHFNKLSHDFRIIEQRSFM